MAYIINQPAPPPMIIEQPPSPPVIIEQPPPPPVIMEQLPPPPVIMEQPPPLGIFQPSPVIMEQPPPPLMVQPAAQPTVTVVQTDAHPMVYSPMETKPTSTRCGVCKQHIITITRPVNGCLTWTVFGSLLVTLLWPFCLIPFCVKGCKDIEHSCPNCKNVIHVHHRMC